MADESELKVSPAHDHWKWLVGLLGGVLVVVQSYSWMETRIERKAEERVLTTTSITRIDNNCKEAKTWLDGRINTLAAELESLRRELTALRQDIRHTQTAQAPEPGK